MRLVRDILMEVPFYHAPVNNKGRLLIHIICTYPALGWQDFDTKTPSQNGKFVQT